MQPNILILQLVMCATILKHYNSNILFFEPVGFVQAMFFNSSARARYIQSIKTHSDLRERDTKLETQNFLARE